MTINRDPGAPGTLLGGGGGTTPPVAWTDGLPDEAKSVVSAKGWKSPADAVTSYANLEKTLGADKIVAPQKTWGDKEWTEFYDRIGRPKDHKTYELPKDVKLNDGITLDDTKLDVAKSTFHKLGLTSQQAEGIMRFYLGTLNSTDSELQGRRKSEVDSGMAELRKSYGDKLDSKLDMARAAVQKFGGQELVAFLDESGMGNNPRLISAFVKVAEGMLEDHAGGPPDSLILKDSTRALNEIKTLTIDKEFQEALNKREHVGHNVAVERWLELHKIAHPPKPQEQD